MAVTYGFVEGEEFEAFGHRNTSQALMGGTDEKCNWWLCGDSLLVKNRFWDRAIRSGHW